MNNTVLETNLRNYSKAISSNNLGYLYSVLVLVTGNLEDGRVSKVIISEHFKLR